MISVFTDKNHTPSADDLANALGDTMQFWRAIEVFLLQKNPSATSEWHFSGPKFGWSFRIKDRKRVLIYLLPRSHFFKIACIFGATAMDQIVASDISEDIKTELKLAKKYAEGSGIRIDVRDPAILDDIKKLVAIKILN